MFRMPILPLQKPEVGAHYELLLRMRDENGRIVAPDNFIAAAERYGITPSIDRWVIENALRPQAGFSDFQKMLEKYARQDSMLVVGHNPNLREFLGRVISDSGCEAVVELKKGAVAKVEMRRNSGSLSWCITPRILRALHAAATESSRPKTSRK